MSDDDNEPAERRCANCLERVRQTRLDADEDEFCGQMCATAYLNWWTAANSVQSS